MRLIRMVDGCGSEFLGLGLGGRNCLFGVYFFVCGMAGCKAGFNLVDSDGGAVSVSLFFSDVENVGYLDRWSMIK